MENIPIEASPEVPIRVFYRLTYADYVMARRYGIRHACRPAILFAFNFSIFIVMIGIGFVIINGQGTDRIPYVLAFFGMFYWLFIRRIVFRWRLMRRLSQRSDSEAELEWQITSQTLILRSHLAKAEYAWLYFFKYVVTPDGIMLYPNKRKMYWLPRHGFASEADYARFKELAHTHLRHYAEVQG